MHDVVAAHKKCARLRPQKPMGIGDESNAQVVDLTLPMSALMMPMRTSLFPAIGSPMITPALAYPAPGDPDVRTTAPFPKPRCPDETLARRRHDLDPYRRRGDIDINEHSGRRHVLIHVSY
jgi:hypothetical protein